MIVSYDVLRRELHAARKPPERSRRHARKYERPRSPLVQVTFHRICMDEVQLVGDASAAETVSMIARAFSVAVSGTPFKNTDDLLPCLRFLRIPGTELRNASAHLQSSLMGCHLHHLFNRIGVRHLKAEVDAQMAIPAQTRQLVPIHFTSIEAAFYDDQRSAGLREVGVDPDSADFQLDEAAVHSVLSRLRRACTHPEIVLRTMTTSFGSLASFSIRSIDDVLDLMLENVDSDILTVSLAKLSKGLNRAQLTLQSKDQAQRLEKALSHLDDLQAQAQDGIADIDRRLQRARFVGPLYRFTPDEIQESREESSSEAVQQDRHRARQMYLGTLRNRRRDVSLSRACQINTLLTPQSDSGSHNYTACSNSEAMLIHKCRRWSRVTALPRVRRKPRRTRTPKRRKSGKNSSPTQSKQPSGRWTHSSSESRHSEKLCPISRPS